MSFYRKILTIITTFIFIFFLIRFVNIHYLDNLNYLNLYEKKTVKYLYTPNAPRGRILDTNNNIIVDNKKVPIINYRKLGLTTKEEISLAYNLITILPISTEATPEELKKFYLLTNNTDYLLTPEEENKYKYRELNSQDIYKIKLERIDKEINNYTLKDRLAIHTFYLMNTGYSTSTKLLLDNVSEEVCATIIEANLKGVTCDYKYVRVNNYDTLKTIIGKTGQITKEKAEYYDSLGYLKDETVGISGLEEYYEETLHGTPAQYQINPDNSLTLISEAKKGDDLVLSIDINIQLQVEEILLKNLKLAKNYAHTEYFNTAYALVGNPNTGEIIAASGLTLLTTNNYETKKEVTSNIITHSFTVGSVVKGASHTVGYQNNAIVVGKKIQDGCVKLYSVPKKCSYKRLGLIDDITALKTSSNYYQFLTAIKVTGNTYKPNLKLNVTELDFNKYRDTFKTYGLGDLTYIDLNNETTGIIGKTIAPDLLLNLAIGQYDTYTPVELLSYINTIATKGNRYALSFKKQQNKLVSTVNLEQEYFNRIQEGFKEVIKSGTGRGYTNILYDPAGKTGTAEVYYDSKTTTINSTYIMYAPTTNPKYSLVVLTPNISYNNDQVNYPAPINRYISKEISDVLFAN